jgi:hypothetical protein
MKLIGATAAAALALLIGVTVAQGHSPVVGERRFTNDNQPLPYKFLVPAGATTPYPAWVYSATNGALTANWPSAADNNSRTAIFSSTATGAGTVEYTPQNTSPCSGLMNWIQCSSGWGTTSFKIYIRNFLVQPDPTTGWRWYDTAGSCPVYDSTKNNACYYARRGLIHEVGHVAVHLAPTAAHTSELETDTVMRAAQPRYNLSGWNTETLRECDEARAQLLYDVRNTAGPYAGCFDHIAGGASPNGLYSKATVAASAYTVCLGTTATATGRLAILTTTNYQELSNNPLSNRTLWFDRKPSTSSTWTPNVASTTASNASPGSNWSRAFTTSATTPITYNFRAYYLGETGVNASLAQGYALFNITWKSAPC